MKIKPQLFSAILLVTFLCACNLAKTGTPVPPTGVVATIVASTLQALTQVPSQTLFSTPTLHPSQTPLPTLMGPSPTVPSPSASFTPTKTPTTTTTPIPSSTPIPQPGSIAGSISGYPYGSIPSLTIVAYGQNPPFNYSYIITGSGSYYSMSTDYLLPGPWQVVAYDAAGHAGGCPGLVTVISNQTVTCNISDWSSSYRSKPSGVPNP